MNGQMVAVLCDILYRHAAVFHCKLFNASSSELYKGHQTYTIQEDDTSVLPTTMYGICKNVGHQIVNSYRTRYTMPFSNGVLFMTESKQRSENFLLKKVANHAKQWQAGGVPLTLGNLESYRNINHCQDIADAIRIILEQPVGDSYVVCGTNFEKVEDLVIQVYRQFNIALGKQDLSLVDLATGSPVVILGSCLRSSITAINGNCVKLRALGWNPKYSTKDILDDIAC